MQLPCSITDLEALKKQRQQRCNRQSCIKLQRNGYWCWRCRRLKQQLCRSYHNSCDPVEELVGRITYEVVFDMLDASTVAAAQWLNTSWRRDGGHTLRLLHLGRQVAHSGGACWLQVHKALRNACV